MKEVWKVIKDYPNYQVSNLGRVKSFNKSKPFIKALTTDKYGYKTTSLSKENKKKTHTVHRLVATAFLKNDKNLPCVNHIDGNKSNNVVSNLEWCSYSYNTQHSYDIEIRVSGMKGKKHSKETLEKMSRIKKGKTHSKESRNKMSKSKKGKYTETNHSRFKGFYVTPNGVFGSSCTAAKANNCTPDTIRNRAKSTKFKEYSFISKDSVDGLKLLAKDSE